MTTLIIIITIVVLYLVCYKTSLRYKTPFKYVTYVKDLYVRKHKAKLTLYFDRERYFGMGLTYTRGMDFCYIEQTDETMVMKTYTFTLHFLFAYFVLILWQPYEKKR